MSNEPLTTTLEFTMHLEEMQ